MDINCYIDQAVCKMASVTPTAFWKEPYVFVNSFSYINLRVYIHLRLKHAVLDTPGQMC